MSEVISEVQYTVKIKAPTNKRICDFMSAIEELAYQYGDISVETVHINPKIVNVISTNRISKVEVAEARYLESDGINKTEIKPRRLGEK